MSFAATIMAFETCERKNNIVIYVNSNGAIQMEETDWTLIESPQTLTIAEVKKMCNDLNIVEKNANEKVKVIENQVAQEVNNNTNERGVVVLGSEKHDSEANIGEEEHGNQKYQF